LQQAALSCNQQQYHAGASNLAAPSAPSANQADLSTLLQQQQAVITTLQRELQEVKGILQAGNLRASNQYGGSYKAMTIQDFRALPDKLILVRHAESVGNVDANTYCSTPDYEVPLCLFRTWQPSNQHCKLHAPQLLLA
jgi:hypothetical protein